MNKILYLLASNILCRGVRRSIIIETLSNKYHFIPNALADIIESTSGKINFDFIRNQYESDSHAIKCLNEYENFLVENDLALLINESAVNHFPKLSLNFNDPKRINNAVIDIDDFSMARLDLIMSQLKGLNCDVAQIRIWRPIEMSDLSKILEIVQQNEISTANLDILFSDELNENLPWIIKRFQFIHIITIFNSPKNLIEPHLLFTSGITIFTKKKLDNPNQCGCVSKEYFNCGQKHISESLAFNTCLNKKISVDVNGNIKNCPSSNNSFGNISSHLLADIIKKRKFQQHWRIHKDKIKVCSGCEFRYICTDCRTFLQDPNDPYSKPLKCGYDPFTMKWSDWKSIPENEDAMKFYGIK